MSSIDAAAIRNAMRPASVARMSRLDVFPEIDSTNAWLMAQAPPPRGMHSVAIADHQVAGIRRSRDNRICGGGPDSVFRHRLRRLRRCHRRDLAPQPPESRRAVWSAG